jgi:hypothetical protein
MVPVKELKSIDNDNITLLEVAFLSNSDIAVNDQRYEAAQ